MSERIKYSLFILLILLCFSSCSERFIPSSYLHPVKKAARMVTGNWITLKLNNQVNPASGIAGELISVTDDTVFVLTQTGLIKLKPDQISSASVYLFKYPGQFFAGYLGLLPNVIGSLAMPEYAGGLMILGVPMVVYTTVQMAIESGSNRKIHYPEDTKLKDLYIYARFPQGLPPGLENLSLK